MQGLDIETNRNTAVIRLPSKVSLDGVVVTFAITLLLLLPALVCFVYIYSFGVNVPFLDEWYFLGYYKDLQLHQTNLLNILAVQHNEHRLGVAYLIELALAQMSHCNSVAQMYLFLGCRALTALLLIDLLAVAHGRGRLSLLLGLPIVMQILSIRQWENLLWGFQPCIGLACLFSVLAIWLLGKHPQIVTKVCAATLAAFLSTFSFASGLVTWPIGIMLVNKNDSGKENYAKTTLLWCCLASLSIGLYLFNYHRVIDPIQAASENAPPLARLCFFIACLGNSIGISKTDCFLSGLVTIALMVATVLPIIKARPRQYFEVGAAVALYGLACVALISLGRCGEHWERATISRYSSLTCFVFVGLYLLNLRKGQVRPLMAAMIATVILFGYTRSIITYWNIGETLRNFHESVAQTMLNWDLMSPLARLSVFREPKEIESLMQFLKQRRLSSFALIGHEQHLTQSDRQPYLKYRVISTLTGNDQNLHFNTKSPAKLLIAGWALEPDALKPLKAIDVIIDNQYSFPAVVGQPCPGGEKEHAIHGSTNRGFYALLSPADFIHGTHAVRLKTYYNNDKEYWESPQITVLSVD
jgi:hypothetical protein